MACVLGLTSRHIARRLEKAIVDSQRWIRIHNVQHMMHNGTTYKRLRGKRRESGEQRMCHAGIIAASTIESKAASDHF